MKLYKKHGAMIGALLPIVTWLATVADERSFTWTGLWFAIVAGAVFAWIGYICPDLRNDD